MGLVFVWLTVSRLFREPEAEVRLPTSFPVRSGKLYPPLWSGISALEVVSTRKKEAGLLGLLIL